MGIWLLDQNERIADTPRRARGAAGETEEPMSAPWWATMSRPDPEARDRAFNFMLAIYPGDPDVKKARRLFDAYIDLGRDHSTLIMAARYRQMRSGRIPKLTEWLEETLATERRKPRSHAQHRVALRAGTGARDGGRVKAPGGRRVIVDALQPADETFARRSGGSLACAGFEFRRFSSDVC